MGSLFIYLAGFIKMRMNIFFFNNIDNQRTNSENILQEIMTKIFIDATLTCSSNV